MKRSISPPPVPRRQGRKSARIAERKPLLEEINLEYSDRNECFELWRAQDSCDTYNRFLPFTESRGRSSKVRLRGTEVADIVREIEEIVANTRKILDEKYLELRNRTQGFVEAAMKVPEVYEAGDLLCKDTVHTL